MLTLPAEACLSVSAVLQRRVFVYARLGFGRSTDQHAPPSPGFIDEEATSVLPAGSRR